MPLLFLLAVTVGPAVILALRVGTWVARALGYGEDPRPGYIDIRKRP